MQDAIPSLLPRNPGHQFVVYADACSGVAGALHERTFASVNNVVRRLNPAPEFILFPGDEIIGGRLLDALDRAGVSRNTIVIYTSDQGFFLGDHGLYDKRFMYDESLRMPLLVRWPAAIAPGSQSGAIGLNVDFAPTLLEAAGLPVPADMQGRSLLPVLGGKTPSDWRTSMYYRYYHDPGDHNTRAHYGVRTETHKLIYFWKKDQWELFDLIADPFELHNLYGQSGHESITAALKAELQRLKQALGDTDA